MTKKRDFKCSKYLIQAMQIYPNRKHKTVKMSPKLANLDENEDLVIKHYKKAYGD